MRKLNPDVNRTKRGWEGQAAVAVAAVPELLAFSTDFPCAQGAWLRKQIAQEKLVSCLVYFPAVSLFVVCAHFRYVRKAKGMARRTQEEVSIYICCGVLAIRGGKHTHTRNASGYGNSIEARTHTHIPNRGQQRMWGCEPGEAGKRGPKTMRVSRSVVAFGTWWLWPWKIGRFAGIDTTLAPRGIISLIIGIGIDIGIQDSGSCLSGSNLRHDTAGFSTDL